jgi:hypothetical protein
VIIPRKNPKRPEPQRIMAMSHGRPISDTRQKLGGIHLTAYGSEGFSEDVLLVLCSLGLHRDREETQKKKKKEQRKK